MQLLTIDNKIRGSVTFLLVCENNSHVYQTLSNVW